MSDQKFVIMKNCVVIWDGITRPEVMDDGRKFSLKVAILNTSPDLVELDRIAQNELREGEFRGNFPAGGHWVCKATDPAKYEGFLPAHAEFNSVSYRAVEVYDVNNVKMDPMQYGNMIYPGAIVDVIVTARSYSNKSKGVGLWCNGVRIVDATAQKLPGISTMDAGAIFGGGQPAGPGMPAPGQPAGPGMPAPGQPAGPGMPAPGQPAGPGVQPYPGILNPPAAPAPGVPVMTALAAGVTYEAFIAQGWTKQQLIDGGYMTRILTDEVPF